ncbi:hypothetical protein BVRB_4g078360 [Beta vulgaris subsp. vulgaris]|nr:hypothetical protein BVRB_4g078360 [Beta vulgaris subsp. vulgaris]
MWPSMVVKKEGGGIGEVESVRWRRYVAAVRGRVDGRL